MHKALVACRAGVGSSVMLTIKVNEVVKDHNIDMKVEHSSLDRVASFDGDILITLADVADELKTKNIKQIIIGINNIMDKEEIFEKLSEVI